MGTVRWNNEFRMSLRGVNDSERRGNLLETRDDSGVLDQNFNLIELTM